jgi:hypothetical protein
MLPTKNPNNQNEPSIRTRTLTLITRSEKMASGANLKNSKQKAEQEKN